jgi:protein involved in polysaccharide export with SLBB domain
VQVPGLVEFTPGLTLMAAVQNRGGVVPKAQLNKVEIQTVDMEKRTVDLGPILAGYAADITLQAGDVVNIPGGERRRSGGSLQQIGIAVIGILLFFLGG